MLVNASTPDYHVNRINCLFVPNQRATQPPSAPQVPTKQIQVSKKGGYGRAGATKKWLGDLAVVRVRRKHTISGRRGRPRVPAATRDLPMIGAPLPIGMPGKAPGGTGTNFTSFAKETQPRCFLHTVQYCTLFISIIITPIALHRPRLEKLLYLVYRAI